MVLTDTSKMSLNLSDSSFLMVLECPGTAIFVDFSVWPHTFTLF